MKSQYPITILICFIFIRKLEKLQYLSTKWPRASKCIPVDWIGTSQSQSMQWEQATAAIIRTYESSSLIKISNQRKGSAMVEENRSKIRSETRALFNRAKHHCNWKNSCHTWLDYLKAVSQYMITQRTQQNQDSRDTYSKQNDQS